MTLAQLYGRVRHFHTDERVAALASRPAGQVVVFLVACALLLPSQVLAAELACAAIALVQLAPERRNATLSLAGVVVLYAVIARRSGLDGDLETAADFALLLGVMAFGGAVSFAIYRAAASFSRLPRFVRRRPLVCLHLSICTFLVLAARLSEKTGTAAAVAAASGAVLIAVAWRLSYALCAGRRGSAARSRFGDHFFYFWPAWGGTAVPYGKGYDHLGRNVARSPDAFTRAQLAGLKCLMLAWLWYGLELLIGGAVHGDAENPVLGLLGGQSLGIPRMRDLIGSDPAAIVPPALRWLSVFLELVTRTLELAIEGHVFVGVLRLLGFHVFRNTYKPLLSESVVEFWNRFHHYFKELLVEFFFLPSYVRYFKQRPVLRIFTATFAAACLGNLYFHVLGSLPQLLEQGATEARELLVPRAFYSLLLASGVFVSMLREQQRRGSAGPPGRAQALRRLRRIAGVWLFFGIIHIWNVMPSQLTFAQRNVFFLSLFGL
jgi:hypothetical protein